MTDFERLCHMRDAFREAPGLGLDAGLPAAQTRLRLAIEMASTSRCALSEAEATRDARDISAFGGWRNFMEQMKVSA